MSKRVLVSMMILAVLMVTGCGSLAKNPAQDAEKVAVEFYRNWNLDGDPGKAWDLGAPGFWGDLYANRDEFIKHQREQKEYLHLTPLPIDTELRVRMFDRAGDYLYLVSDKQDQMLIWVTQTTDGSWKVRRTLDYREGMDIPW